MSARNRCLTLLLAAALFGGAAAVHGFFDLLDPRIAQLTAGARAWIPRFNVLAETATNDRTYVTFVRDELNLMDPALTYALATALYEPYQERAPRNGVSNIYAVVSFINHAAPVKWLEWLAAYYERLDGNGRAIVLGAFRHTDYAEAFDVLVVALGDTNELAMTVTNPVPYWPLRVGDAAYCWLMYKLARSGELPPEFDRWLVIGPTHSIQRRDEMIARLRAFWQAHGDRVLDTKPHVTGSGPGTLAPGIMQTLLRKARGEAPVGLVRQ